MRFKRTLYTLVSTLVLMTYCAKAVPKKKRVVIHVPETVKHIHHHITKKVPLPIVVFTKNPKEHKEHKEYHDHKEYHYPSITEDHHYGGAGGYGEYGEESNQVARGIRQAFAAADVEMARGVVADFHEVKPKIHSSDQYLPRHLTPPPRFKGKSLETTYWHLNDGEQHQHNYGTIKAYRSAPTAQKQKKQHRHHPVEVEHAYERPPQKRNPKHHSNEMEPIYDGPSHQRYPKHQTHVVDPAYESPLQQHQNQYHSHETDPVYERRPNLRSPSDVDRPTAEFEKLNYETNDSSYFHVYPTERTKSKKKKKKSNARTPHMIDMASSKSSWETFPEETSNTFRTKYIEDDYKRTFHS